MLISPVEAPLLSMELGRKRAIEKNVDFWMQTLSRVGVPPFLYWNSIKALKPIVKYSHCRVM